jgi:hypothetical protein
LRPYTKNRNAQFSVFQSDAEALQRLFII